MPIRDLKAQIGRLPEQPGVYLYYNGAGETLYVGKARVLRDRVRSYLGAQGMSPRIDALLGEAQRLEFIVTDSVVEALALENHLIKQRVPKYNIMLRDDKNYPYLQLTVGEAFPRVLVARHVERDDHFYAGPYLPASLARKTMSLTHKLFGLRSCNEAITGNRERPCLEFDIKRCVAPCVREICSEDEYRAAVAHTRLFLEGRNDELLTTLKGRMAEAASEERFEQAAQLRDAARTVETLATRQQKMSRVEIGDRDAFGIKAGPSGAVVQVFEVRGGRVVERVELVTESADPSNVAESDILQAALQQFYAERVAPPEIDMPVAFSDSDAEMLEGWLSAGAGRRVRLCVPKRGEKRGLLDLAARNAAVGYQARFNENVAANYDALETLRAVLSLPSLPRRIECFDISTIQGSETVASMVVCEDGRMKRSEYRKFKIRGPAKPSRAMIVREGPPVDTPAPAAAASSESSSTTAAESGGGVPLALILDDFASMHEVVLRRYRKLLEQGGPFPDLVLIDGGKGQLASAYQALEELGLANLMGVGIAKKEEILFTRQYVDGIALPKTSPALLLIQRIRDEAHRFAVTFHRASRTKRDLTSELDAIPGIGSRRRKSLLTAFGSLAGVRRATREDLVRVVGTKCAEAVLGYFAGGIRQTGTVTVIRSAPVNGDSPRLPDNDDKS
ncbi:MAG: excinuclease ABC subunit UvrC [Acidobacteria bacterium]|nr:excinuclease ABC subunit UvrC [Acidobacteriota bacterium]